MPHSHALRSPSPVVDRISRSRAGLLARRIVEEWQRVDGTHYAAALAYYSVLSLAPFLLVIVAVTGWLLGSDRATHYLLAQVADVAGAQTAQFIGSLIAGAHPIALREGARALVGVVATLLGATATFVALKRGLDRVFGSGVHGAFAVVRTRLLSFGLVIGVAVLSIVSLVLSAAVHAALAHVTQVDRGRTLAGAVANEVLSFVVLSVAFAAILRVLPECPPARRGAWVGALTAAALFMLGKFAIAWYLGHFALASAYGAAGAIVVVMLWIYWSSALFFAGAVVAHVVDRPAAGQEDADLAPAGIA